MNVSQFNQVHSGLTRAVILEFTLYYVWNKIFSNTNTCTQYKERCLGLAQYQYTYTVDIYLHDAGKLWRGESSVRRLLSPLSRFPWHVLRITFYCVDQQPAIWYLQVVHGFKMHVIHSTMAQSLCKMLLKWPCACETQAPWPKIWKSEIKSNKQVVW